MVGVSTTGDNTVKFSVNFTSLNMNILLILLILFACVCPVFLWRVKICCNLCQGRALPPPTGWKRISMFLCILICETKSLQTEPNERDGDFSLETVYWNIMTITHEWLIIVQVHVHCGHCGLHSCFLGHLVALSLPLCRKDGERWVSSLPHSTFHLFQVQHTGTWRAPRFAININVNALLHSKQ